MPNTGRRPTCDSNQRFARSALVAMLAAVLVAVGLHTPVALAAPTALPGVPVDVSATAGPGRSHVSFRPADTQATSFTVTAWNGTTAAATATATTSPVLIWGLSYGSTYTFTVKADNAVGSSAQSRPSASIKPTGPVTNAVPLAGERRFINQSTSFNSIPGTAASRRPQASESLSASLYNPASQGVPAGKEWRMLWLRAMNCEAAPRQIEFFIQQETPTSTPIAKFVQGDTWTAGQPNRSVAVAVAPNGGELSWAENSATPLVITAGQSVGARWYGLTGGGTGCNWQFGAIEQPAGTGVAASSAALPSTTIGATFKASLAGARASWRTVAPNTFWLPATVTATNCESGPRRIEVILLGPGNITQGVVTPTANGSGPVVVPAGGKLTWSASALRSRLVLPEGWSLGVRWLDMAGNAPTATCAWSATVSVGTMGTSAAAFDAAVR